MKLSFVLTYLSLFFLISLPIYYCDRLRKKYSSSFVRMFFYYVSTYFTWLFLNLTPKLMFSQTSIENIGGFQIIISAITLPLLILGLFLFLKFAENLTQFELPRWFMWFFWSMQFIFYSGFLLLSIFLAAEGYPRNVGFFLAMINFVPMVFGCLPPIIMTFLTHKLSDKREIRFSKTIGIYYLIAYAGMFIFLEFWEAPFHIFQDQTHAFLLIILVVYLLNIPPIFYMTFFFKQHSGYFSGERISTEDQDLFLKEMKITPREWDIIKLILKGKTNPEVAALLFISPKTVKNNLTGIYRKLKVGNRVQLVRKISSKITLNE